MYSLPFWGWSWRSSLCDEDLIEIVEQRNTVSTFEEGGVPNDWFGPNNAIMLFIKSIFPRLYTNIGSKPKTEGVDD